MENFDKFVVDFNIQPETNNFVVNEMYAMYRENILEREMDELVDYSIKA